MKQLIVTGNTYPLRESLKKDGFRWNPQNKSWSKTSSNDGLINTLAQGYEENGLKSTIKAITDSNERRYWVKESCIFNLESMDDKLWVIENDIDEGRLQFPLKIAGKELKDYDDIQALRDEVYELEDKAKRGKVTGHEYGRILEIVAWRVEVRYAVCMSAGMDESQAGQCFEDM